MGSYTSQYGCRVLVGRHLHVDHRGNLGQGLCRHARRRHGQGERLCDGQGRWDAQDAGLGFDQVRRARVDHQSGGARVGEEEDMRQRKRLWVADTVLPRTIPVGSHRRDNAGSGQTGSSLGSQWRCAACLGAPSAGQAKRAMGLVESAQGLPKATVAEGILTPPISYYSTDAWAVPAENQFKKWQYPIPKEEGGTEIHMIWDESACHTSCYCSGFRYMEAMRKPTVEFLMIQHPTLENDCLLADMILPVTWAFEENDINTGGDAFRTMVYTKQNIPRGGGGEERLRDRRHDRPETGEARRRVRRRLRQIHGRKDRRRLDQVRLGKSGVKDKITWEKFSEKAIYIAPVDPKWKEQKSGIIDFANDPVKNPLKTPTGKLEFYSQRLADNFPDDNERNPMPKWVEGGPGFTNDESPFGERAKKYPLALSDTIRRWGHHSMMSDVPWLAETANGPRHGL